MMSDNAKFRYSASEGTVELEGSEDFITRHIEVLTDLARLAARHVVVESRNLVSDPVIATAVEDIVAGEATPEVTAPVVEASISQKISETIQDYPGHFEEINSKLKIVCDIPGSNTRAKMLNAAILYCYGSKLLGDEQVPAKSIRVVCEEHGILDSNNFSKIFGDKTIFLSDGVKGGNKDIKLTFNGTKKARELLGRA
ncbi:hypothetical protein F6V05_29055 [Pseudomonas aeruginosa]|uniref:hypothetical protein n=1 Tax=Pseudomonas aeruginosa TaxID=287 RepID=UPI001AE06077|nr:hypothetical protein [Pseudomonas aeruginosa]EIU7190178.1 hypothetical protein [Pseudomonas aeruginosa]EKU9565757.1 hypothetical protein [Pseudomonas aeruginosa]MDF1652959.1 hypothetical protein [Pseudomonas aeruginosa]